MARALVASAGRHADPVRAIAAARTLRRRELARVASADLLGHARGHRGVQGADVGVGGGAAGRAGSGDPGQHARRTVRRRRAIAVIGMGRLGGGELGYGSDADVMFVCEPIEGVDESAAVRWSVTVAEQVRALLGTPSADPPLEVDASLRPEGRNGPLVRTLSSYAAYYEQWAQPWEIQALLRAHRVAGDEDLGERFLLMADKTRYPPGGVSAEAVQEIRRIKARVDAERLPRGADPNTHTKLGRGGLADIEWTVQLLQLRHAHKIPALHNTSTLADAGRDRRGGADRRGRCRPAAGGVADRDQGAQCAGAGAGQANRPAAGTGPPAQRGRAGGGLGHRRRRRVPRQLPAGDPSRKDGGTKGVRWLRA